MRPALKVGMVVAGYFAAFVAASAVVAIHVAATSGPDRQGSSGMYAFGDALLFLAVFGVAAVPPTGAVLFFLRPYRSFWRVLSVVALGITSTAFVGLLDYSTRGGTRISSILYSASNLAPLRVLAAPLFALGFLLCGLLAPNRTSRIVFLVATAIETAVFVYVAFVWFQPFRPQ